MYTFEEIIGNEQMIKQIQKIYIQKTYFYAYIIHGEAGTGKKLLANTIAKTMQCKKARHYTMHEMNVLAVVHLIVKITLIYFM